MTEKTPDPAPPTQEIPAAAAPAPASAPAPAPAPAPAVAAVPVQQPSRFGRLPILVAVGALLLGCLIGAGFGLVGGLAIGHDRGHIGRYDGPGPGREPRFGDRDGYYGRPGGPGRGDQRRGPGNVVPAPAPSSSS